MPPRNTKVKKNTAKLIGSSTPDPFGDPNAQPDPFFPQNNPPSAEGNPAVLPGQGFSEGEPLPPISPTVGGDTADVPVGSAIDGGFIERGDRTFILTDTQKAQVDANSLKGIGGDKSSATIKQDLTSLFQSLNMTPEEEAQLGERIQLAEAQGPGLGRNIIDALSGKTIKEAAEEQGTGLVAEPISIGGPFGFKIGKDLFGNALKAVQAGKIASWAKKAKPIMGKLRNWGIALASGKILFGDLFTTKVDEQQQGLNTLGTITSSIVGDSTSGAGDWRKGLVELRFIRKELLALESDIKSGKIKNFQMKINGKIIDIDADIFDQLATINEGISDITTFAIQGVAPQLSEQELQVYMRQLEQEGIIEPVDLSASRRDLAND